MKTWSLESAIFACAIAFIAQFLGASCANILFYFGVTGFSHVYSVYPLIEALADRGHNITLLTPFPIETTGKPGINITTIISHELLQLFSPTWDEDEDLIRNRIENNHDSFWDTLLPSSAVDTLSVAACEIVLTSPTTAPMVHNSQFDLVVHDTGLNECAVGLARHKYNAPFIGYSAVSVLFWYHDSYGIPFETSAISDMETAGENSSPLTLLQKVMSVYNSILWSWNRKIRYYPALDEVLQTNLGLTERPSIEDLMTETSLVFINTHYTTDDARALPPLFVPVGGMQITEQRQPLPQEITAFLGEATGRDYLGFIYVSFGTAVHTWTTDSEVKEKLFNAMGNSTRLKFVCKWEGQIPADAPKNVYFSNWLPQQDLFAHKDIVGVIGHGGINGIHESIHFGLPMIIFPIFADQDFNANALESKGLCIKMEFASFTQSELEHAIGELVTNQQLKANAEFASREFRDRPVSPVQTALWWTEYVLRHKNTTSLKSVTRKQTWYEKRLLDVWVVVFIVLQLMLGLLLMMVFKLYKFLTWMGSKMNTIRMGIKKDQ